MLFSARAEEPKKPADYVLQQRWLYKSDFISDSSFTPESGKVVYFRNAFALQKAPKELFINITADNKYRLFVNGKYVCRGSESGDFNRWFFDSVDIAKYLKAGKNVIAVEVVDFGNFAPYSFHSKHLGLWIQSGSPNSDFTDTLPKNWKCKTDAGISFFSGLPKGWQMFFSGGGEKIDAAKNTVGWQNIDFDDSSWKPAVRTLRPNDTRVGGRCHIILTPRMLPQLEETPIRLKKVVRAENLGDVKPADIGFIRGEKFTIPANTHCKILLDNSALTNAYTRLSVDGGRGAFAKISYCESLANPKISGHAGKGNRNETDEKIPYHPVCDEYKFDGAKREFTTLNFRCFRYVELEINTGDSPLDILDFGGVFTGYPFAENAKFSSSDKSLSDIWNVCWRTARLCAWDTYFDCPFYERLQYIGDTRIQALISLYVSGDSRLMKKALEMFDVSRLHHGLTTSRYPSRTVQVIPPFSLYWVNMIADYRRHVDDDAFVKTKLNGIETVMNWFSERIDPKTSMLVADMEFWNFVDWVRDWRAGVPPDSGKSGSAILSLQFAAALSDAAEIMRDFGRADTARRYGEICAAIKRGVYENCWRADRGLLSDAAGLERFSQHANIMGILTDAIPAEKQGAVFEKISANAKSSYSPHKPDDIMEATFYYKFYLFQAAAKLGRGDEFLNMLSPWRDMLEIGLTTFAENPEPARSDCHAWSASPMYEFLSLVAGITPNSNGFRSVKISPNLGALKFVRAEIPHRLGAIKTDYAVSADGMGLDVCISLPDGLSGEFFWRGNSRSLVSGVNAFKCAFDKNVKKNQTDK